MVASARKVKAGEVQPNAIPPRVLAKYDNVEGTPLKVLADQGLEARLDHGLDDFTETQLHLLFDYVTSMVDKLVLDASHKRHLDLIPPGLEVQFRLAKSNEDLSTSRATLTETLEMLGYSDSVRAEVSSLKEMLDSLGRMAIADAAARGIFDYLPPELRLVVDLVKSEEASLDTPADGDDIGPDAIRSRDPDANTASRVCCSSLDPDDLSQRQLLEQVGDVLGAVAERKRALQLELDYLSQHERAVVMTAKKAGRLSWNRLAAYFGEPASTIRLRFDENYQRVNRQHSRSYNSHARMAYREKRSDS